MFGLLVVMSAIAVLLFYNFVWKRRNLPPGPTPLPFFGNKLELNRETPGYSAFLRWEFEYGPVFTYWMGEFPVVAVSDFALIDETFVRDGDAYSGRAFLSQFFAAVKGGASAGVLNTEGEAWAQTRRFSLQVLRNLGMGKSVLEGKIMNEVRMFMQSIDRDLDAGQDVQNIVEKLDNTVGSIINQLTFGFSLYGDRADELAKLKHLAHEHIKSVDETLTKTVMMIPALRYLPIFSSAFKRAESRIIGLNDYYDRQIDATIATQQREDSDRENAAEPRYFVEAFLRKIEQSKGTKEEKYFNRKNLRGICHDLFVAGQDTTANTLSFLVGYLIRWPRYQHRLHEELDTLAVKILRKRGDDDNFTITNAERNQLPFTNAVICETQRLCNLVPETPHHKTTRDVNIAGFRIPKGTRIVPQIANVMYNEKIFPDPHSFRPERFLDEDGKLKVYKELVPFSVGKRRCLGESLAKMELFLITTNLFYFFKFSIADPTKPPTLRKIPGITITPESFCCRIERRIKNSFRKTELNID